MGDFARILFSKRLVNARNIDKCFALMKGQDFLSIKCHRATISYGEEQSLSVAEHSVKNKLVKRFNLECSHILQHPLELIQINYVQQIRFKRVKLCLNAEYFQTLYVNENNV